MTITKKNTQIHINLTNKNQTMSALTKLLEFNSKLPLELRAEQFLLINDLHNEFKEEKSKLMDKYERIIRAMQDTKPFEVVAVAGTAETLLTDVTDTNVGEINVGDTVELNPNEEQSKMDAEYLVKDGENIKSLNIVTKRKKFEEGVCIEVNNGKYWHRAELFRKVSTPIVNPIQNVSGC
jgi:hypothetical protein